MIYDDDNGHQISQFSKTYNQFKSVFSTFKGSIKSEFTESNEFNILVKNETETKITLEFINRQFTAELSMFRRDERSFLGKIVFSEIVTEGETIKIDQTFIDRHGNVKETPTSQFSELTLTQEEASIFLLKYWFVKFIENNIEQNENA